MAKSQIENEQWDFVEIDGVEVRLPPASGQLHLPALEKGIELTPIL